MCAILYKTPYTRILFLYTLENCNVCKIFTTILVCFEYHGLPIKIYIFCYLCLYLYLYIWLFWFRCMRAFIYECIGN